MYLLNEQKQVKSFVIFLLVFALLVTGCVGPLVTTAMAGGPSVTEQLGINNKEDLEVPEAMDDVSEKEVDLIGEDIDLRSKYIKQFVREDKATQAVIYNQAVHYEKDGVFEDIDNSLVLSKNDRGSEVYQNKDNGYYNVSLNTNENTRGETILMERKGGSLSWKLGSVNTGEKEILTRESEEKKIEILSNGTADRKAIASRNEQKMMLENLTSGARYSNVYEGVSLEYFMLPEKVKENIVLDRYISNAEFVFNLSMGNLDAKQREDGMIVLINSKTGEEVFYIEAPYMIDAEMEYSADVRMVLVQDGDNTQLVITPSDEWLQKAAYPVKIDPTVVTDIAVANIRDAFVSEGFSNTNYQTSTILKVGEGSSSQTNLSFIKFKNLPAIDSSHMVVDARLNLYLWKNTGEDNVQVNVHKVNDNWDSSTIKWCNMPGYNSIVEDYEIVSSINTGYSWEITDIAREWYQTGDNFGLMVRETPNDNDYIEFYSSDGWGSITMPYSTITYVSNAGLEAYWTYHSQSAGRAGTGYVNDYNGNLIWVHNDLSMTGSRMPVSLSHVFNSCYKADDDYYLGKGWRLNLSQEVGYETISGVNYYTYLDSDGTKHYFYNDNGKWKIESGLDLTLSIYSSYITIKDKSDNVLKFDTIAGGGELKSITDRNGNVQTLNYTSGKLTSVVDGAGRTTYLYYNGAGGRLSQIKDPAGRSMYFGYSYDKLKNIQYPDHTSNTYRKTEFTYNDNGDLTKAKNYDGYEIGYGYSSAEPHRVISINEKNGSTNGGQLTLSYGGNSTTYTDGSGREEYLHFDDHGRTVGGVNDQGQGAFSEHSSVPGINFNKLTASSKMQKSVVNFLTNSGAEEGVSDWDVYDYGSSSGTSGYCTDKPLFGSKSFYINKTSSITSSSTVLPRPGLEVIEQTVQAEKGKFYTMSAYLYADNNYTRTGGGAFAYIKYKDDDGVWKFAPSEYIIQKGIWNRVTVTFMLPTNASTSVIKAGIGMVSASGKVWCDNLQLEEGKTANTYNLVENSDYVDGESSWVRGNMLTSDGVINSTSGHPNGLDSNVFKITGRADQYTFVGQYINITGSAGDVYTVGGWVKADAIPHTGPRCSITVRFYDTDDTYDVCVVDINEDYDGWQFICGQAVAVKPYIKILVYYSYFHEENTALFDGMFLNKEQFGQSYAYDEDGNIISATDLAEKKSNFDFDSNNDLVKLTTPKGNEFKYTYDSKHNVTGAETAKGVDYSFTYDSYGNNTSSKVYNASGSNAGFIKAGATYDSNGNYINTVTDARGKVTDYDFSSTKGTLTQVEDAAGNVVRYSYDSKLDRLDYVWLDLDKDGVWDSNEPKNTYTYVGDSLDKVTVNGFNYDFNYDALGNLDTVKVGSQTLINNDYNLSKGLLTNSAYGNADSVSYTYDNLDRISQLNYDGGAAEFKYFYDANGMIGYMVDNENGVEYRYLYDEANRPGSIVRDNGITSWYKYDDNLSTPTKTEYFYESIRANNDTYETEYKSDEDGRPTSTIISVDGGTDYKVGYSYDYLSRPTSKKYYTGTTQKYKEEYTYLAGGHGANSTTTLVSKIEYNDNCTLSYTYDNVGNISTISDGTNVIQYYYDDLNQLYRENNPYTGKTIFYYYDLNGNIDVSREYDYCTGSGTPTTQLINIDDYTYNGTWDDKLASYDGKAITYDCIGNPLTYDGWNYTWKWGRRLATAGNTSQGISTSYKYNDSGIRTQKTVTNNGNTTTYKYNLIGSKITYEERTGANACEMYYAYDNSGKLFGFYYDGASNDGFYFYKRNLQGDIIGILNSSGTEVTTYLYDAWGKLISKTGTLASTVGSDNPFRYRGYYYDDETGLYYLNQRYYNPDWRRFINADTLIGIKGDLLGHNVFAYCQNNPVIFSDPSGFRRVDYVENGEIVFERELTKEEQLLATIYNQTDNEQIKEIINDILRNGTEFYIMKYEVLSYQQACNQLNFDNNFKKWSYRGLAIISGIYTAGLSTWIGIGVTGGLWALEDISSPSGYTYEGTYANFEITILNGDGFLYSYSNIFGRVKTDGVNNDDNLLIQIILTRH